MASIDESIRHLLRRAGFGASPQELGFYTELGRSATVRAPLQYEQFDDDVDACVGQPGYISVAARGAFSPHTVINDARQRWLFRMVHSARPLQEKMTLFWHNHFATVYSKVAGAAATGAGTKVFWVQLGGFDTHASQVGANGAYPRLMAELNNAVTAFYTDLRNQSLLSQVLMMGFSEFGRRAYEHGSVGCDHSAAGLMFVVGGRVRGGLYGTAASLNPDPANPTLENNGGDVCHEIDFRSVYARVIDGWLATDSVSLLGADFRRPDLAFI
jgi:uncharacterized protein (DUF1501 family)